MPIVPFGDYLPDMPAFGNGGALTATNVYPEEGNYKEYNRLETITNALDDRCIGATGARDTNANATNFAGTATKLYRLTDATTWTDVSKAGDYSTTDPKTWEFTTFGNLVIASNFDDPIQVYELGTSTEFADLSATAPKARHITTIGGFVFAGNVFDSIDGNRPNRVWWSPFEDPQGTWDSANSQTTQTDFQDLEDSGPISKIVPVNKDAVVITERRIERFVYEGTPLIFGRYTVETNRGTEIPNSVVPYATGFFYYGNDGFYAFDGTRSVAIGNQRIDNTFAADLDVANQSRMFGVVDPIRKLVMWAYPGANNTGGLPNKIIVYNWREGRWSLIEEEVECIFPSLSVGLTLDQLDTITTNLDALPASLDSRQWAGGLIQMAAFDGTHMLGYFNGLARDATLETGEFQPIPGRRAYVENVRPIVTGGTLTVQGGSRETFATGQGYSGAATMNDQGEGGVDIDARYHRYRVNISGGFTDAQGIEYEPRDGGVQ